MKGYVAIGEVSFYDFWSAKIVFRKVGQNVQILAKPHPPPPYPLYLKIKFIDFQILDTGCPTVGKRFECPLP